MVQGAREQRHDHGNERAEAPGGRALRERRAAGALRVEDGRELVGERGDEAQHEREDHGELVGRKAEARERREDRLEGVGELGGRGREQEQQARADRDGDAQRVEHGRPGAGRGDGHGSERDEGLAAADEQQIEEAQQDDHDEKGARRLEQSCRADAGGRRGRCREGEREGELGRRAHEEREHHEREGADDLGARVEPVDGGVGRVVLAEGDAQGHG